MVRLRGLAGFGVGVGAYWFLRVLKVWTFSGSGDSYDRPQAF